MKKGAGKKKGNSYQRQIAKILSLWITANRRDDILWPSNSSGAQYTVASKKDKNRYATQCGDLQAIESEGQWLIQNFSIELKHYANLDLDNFLLGTPSQLASFWEKHKLLADSVQRRPILIAKQNRKPDLVLLDWELTKRHCLDTSYDGVLLAKHECGLLLLDKFLTISYTKFQTLLT